MNLHNVASPVVSAVNPMRLAKLQLSAGARGDGVTGRRTPAYMPPLMVSAQVQPMSTPDLRQVDGLNLGGVVRAIYVSGKVSAIERINQRGGDLITTADLKVWLTKMVLEQWPGWCKVVAVLQDGS